MPIPLVVQNYELSDTSIPVKFPPLIAFGKQEAFNVGANLFGAVTSGVLTYALFRALSNDPSIWWKIVFGLAAIGSGVTASLYLYQTIESAR